MQICFCHQQLKILQNTKLYPFHNTLVIYTDVHLKINDFKYSLHMFLDDILLKVKNCVYICQYIDNAYNLIYQMTQCKYIIIYFNSYDEMALISNVYVNTNNEK